MISTKLCDGRFTIAKKGMSDSSRYSCQGIFLDKYFSACVLALAFGISNYVQAADSPSAVSSTVIANQHTLRPPVCRSDYSAGRVALKKIVKVTAFRYVADDTAPCNQKKMEQK